MKKTLLGYRFTGKKCARAECSKKVKSPVGENREFCGYHWHMNEIHKNKGKLCSRCLKRKPIKNQTLCVKCCKVSFDYQKERKSHLQIKKAIELKRLEQELKNC